MNWQPIETAPKNRLLLGAQDGMIRIIIWNNGWDVVGIMMDKHWFNPTHWMPLPEPPEPATK